MAVLITCGATPLGLEVAQEFAEHKVPFEILDDLDGVDLSKLEGKPFTHGHYYHPSTVRRVCHTYNIDTIVHLDLRPQDSESLFDTAKLALAAYDCGVDAFIYLTHPNPDGAQALTEAFISLRFPDWGIVRPTEGAKETTAEAIYDTYTMLWGLK